MLSSCLTMREETTTIQEKVLSNVIREYHDSNISSSPNTLIVSLGYHQKFFRIEGEFKGDNDVLLLRDPFSFLFYKGLSGEGNIDELEDFIKKEIQERKPKKVIFTSLCITGWVTFYLGLKLKVDAIICFSPWTHFGEEYSNGLKKNYCNDPNDRFNYIAMILEPFVNRMETDLDFRDTMNKLRDLNRWSSLIDEKKTKILLFFNRGELDRIAEKHIDDKLRSKIKISWMESNTTNRDTIRQAIMNNIMELNI